MNALTLSPNAVQQPALRRLILIDAAACAGSGALLALLAGPLSDLFGLPEWLLRSVGIGLLPFAVVLGRLGLSSAISRRAGWALVVTNGIWIAASGMLLVVGQVEPTSTGVSFIIVQALAVAALALLEYIALRRPPGMSEEGSRP